MFSTVNGRKLPRYFFEISLILCLLVVQHTRILCVYGETLDDSKNFQGFNNCTITSTESCAFDDLEGPTLIRPGGKTRCAYDDTDTTSKEYIFQVNPGSGEDRSKLLLFFQGGGGCVSNSTCSYATQQIIAGFRGEPIFKPVIRVFRRGIFDRENVKNPFRNWTVVMVSYCTGDVHVGNTVVNDIPNDPSNKATYLNGANNAEAVLNWTFDNFKSPDQLLLTGCSAGALGVQIWSAKIISHFKPITRKISVVLDSYPGYLPEELKKVYNYLNACDSRFGLAPELIEACKAEKLLFPDTVKSIIAENRDIPFGYITSKNDAIQKFFWCIATFRNQVFNIATKFRNCISQPDFYGGNKALLEEYMISGEQNNVVSYVLDGDAHCFMMLDAIYEASNGENSSPLLEWIGSLTADNLDQIIVQSSCVSRTTSDIDMDYSCNDQLSTSQYVGMDLRSTIKVSSTSMIAPITLAIMTIIAAAILFN